MKHCENGLICSSKLELKKMPSYIRDIQGSDLWERIGKTLEILHLSIIRSRDVLLIFDIITGQGEIRKIQRFASNNIQENRVSISSLSEFSVYARDNLNTLTFGGELRRDKTYN